MSADYYGGPMRGQPRPLTRKKRRMLDYHEQLLCRLLDVLDLLNCGVFIADRGGSIEYANRRLSEMMCRLPVELAGVSLRKLYAGDPSREVERVLATLGAGIEHELYLPMA